MDAMARWTTIGRLNHKPDRPASLLFMACLQLIRRLEGLSSPLLPDPGRAVTISIDERRSLISPGDFVERNGVFHVNAEAHDRCGAAIPIVAGIGHVLVVDRKRDPAPDMNGVVRFEDLFQAVVKSAIAQDEPQSAQSQISPVIAGDPVGDECGTYPVMRTVPRLAAEVTAKLGGPVDFRIGV